MNQEVQERAIPLTMDQVREIIRRAYRLSQPQGMGWLHYEEGDIPEEMVEKIIAGSTPRWGIEMDYVMGRSIKLSIDRNGDAYFFRDTGRWYDHQPEQLRELLQGIE